MRPTTGLPIERFLQTLEIVAREGKHLSYSLSSLFRQTIEAEWVRNLEQDPGVPSGWKLLCRGLDVCKTRWRINYTQVAARPRRGSMQSN